MVSASRKVMVYLLREDNTYMWVQNVFLFGEWYGLFKGTDGNYVVVFGLLLPR